MPAIHPRHLPGGRSKAQPPGSPNTRLRFSIRIAAPVATVWQAVITESTFRQWASVFTEGFYFEGSWDRGSTIRFLTPEKSGTVARVIKNRLHQLKVLEHYGAVVNGVDDTESASVESWAPAFESYAFDEVDGAIELVVQQDAIAGTESFLCETWPVALERLRALCEAP